MFGNVDAYNYSLRPQTVLTWWARACQGQKQSGCKPCMWTISLSTARRLVIWSCGCCISWQLPVAVAWLRRTCRSGMHTDRMRRSFREVHQLLELPVRRDIPQQTVKKEQQRPYRDHWTPIFNIHGIRAEISRSAKTPTHLERGAEEEYWSELWMGHSGWTLPDWGPSVCWTVHLELLGTEKIVPRAGWHSVAKWIKISPK